MPKWVEVEKYCEVCGKPLTLRNARDIERKRFCSRECLRKGTRNGWEGKHLSGEHKKKISEAKKGTVSMEGESHWRTGKGSSKGDYRYKWHEGKLKREHQVVIENIVGRELYRNEAIHHLDGDRGNNAIENLELITRAEHTRRHVAEDRKRYLAAQGG